MLQGGHLIIRQKTQILIFKKYKNSNYPDEMGIDMIQTI